MFLVVFVCTFFERRRRNSVNWCVPVSSQSSVQYIDIVVLQRRGRGWGSVDSDVNRTWREQGSWPRVCHCNLKMPTTTIIIGLTTVAAQNEKMTNGENIAQSFVFCTTFLCIYKSKSKLYTYLVFPSFYNDTEYQTLQDTQRYSNSSIIMKNFDIPRSYNETHPSRLRNSRKFDFDREAWY